MFAYSQRFCLFTIKIYLLMNIVFAGLARNCQNSIKKNINFIDKFRNQYPNINIYLYILESDSVDGTKEYLSEVKTKYSRIYSVDNLDARFDFRTERIAFCRNYLLEKINNEIDSNDFIYIPLDLDIEIFKYTNSENFFDLLNILENSEAEVIFPFSYPYYYDIHALRSKGWNIKNPWHAVYSINKYLIIGKFFTRYYFVYRKQKKYNEHLAEVQVDSAFGGIGVYKVNKAKFKELKYSIDLKYGNTSCEHIAFNNSFKKKIICPSWKTPSPGEHIEYKLLDFNKKIKYIYKSLISDFKNII